MPVNYCGSFWESDPRKWERCRQQVAADMVAAGWHPKASKFSEVQRKKAMKLFFAK